MKKNVVILTLALLLGTVLTGGCQEGHPAGDREQISYETSMVDLISSLKQYSEKKHPGFGLIANGGAALFQESEENSISNIETLSRSLEGVMAESIYYGWDMKDNVSTPAEETEYMEENVSKAQSYGMVVFSLDYCHSPKRVVHSYEENDAHSYIGWASPSRELTVIPRDIHHENERNISSLRDVKNYLVLLNGESYAIKEKYLADLGNTNYDLLIIDRDFNGQPLSREEVASLKKKANGARRLVYAYMSIGEAESYRSYWDPSWDIHQPSWLEAGNPEWEGNYKVKYWKEEWHHILYGSESSYLDQIINAGFDGAFLDVVDGYEYFKS